MKYYLYILSGLLSILIMLGCSETSMDSITNPATGSEALQGQSMVLRDAVSDDETAGFEQENFISEPPFLNMKYHAILNESAAGAEIQPVGEVTFVYAEDKDAIEYTLQLKNPNRTGRITVALHQQD